MGVQGSNNGGKGRTNKLLILIIILLLLILIAGGVVVILLLQDKPNEMGDEGTMARGTIVTQDNAEDIMAGMGEEELQDGYYNVSMSIVWHFKDGVSKDAVVANKETNTRTVYFDLLTEDTEELVYSSPYIPVGESLQGITLDKALESGVYDMIVKYHLVDENNREVSSVSTGITIYVE